MKRIISQAPQAMNMAFHIKPILAAFALILLLPIFAEAQTPVALMPNPRITFFDGNGLALQNGCIAFYNAGTSTPAPIYAESTGTFQLANPLTLDASGSATVWLANQSYKLVASTGVTGMPCSTSPGAQIWVVDNVSAYQIINQAQDIFLAGGTSDPIGVAGELSYRTDLGKVRFFSTIWDSLVGEVTAATLTNKTIDLTANTLSCVPNTSGQYVRNNGTKLVCANIQTGDLPANYNGNIQQFYGNALAGTITNSLVKFVNGGVVTTATTDIGGAVGICVSNCSATGNATIDVMGQVTCNFDGSTTGADYVTISSIVAGDCHDAGASFPSAGQQVIGRVIITGNEGINLFPAESRGSGVVYSTIPATVTTSIPATQMAVAPVMGAGQTAVYRFSGYVQTNGAGTGCSGSTTITITVQYTLDISAIVNWNVTGQTSTGTTSQTFTIATSGNGTPNTPVGPIVPFVFAAGQNAPISFYTTYTLGGSCSLGPSYTVFPILERLN